MPIQTVSQAFTNEGVGGFSFRNKIINGGMEIDQRNAGASVTVDTFGKFGVDRWASETGGATGGGIYTAQRSSDAPAGFKNSLLCTVTTTDTSLASGDLSEVAHKIEGFNITDLAWGTANAKPVTLSFWVKSSVTGSFSLGFQNNGNNRSYVAVYTINSANTWEYKTITVPGDTAGTWSTDNGIGLQIRWCFSTGSARVASAANTWEGTNRIAISSTSNPLMGTNGATWQITGAQLEVGSVATPFERRPYGLELALCQRYYFKYGNLSAASTYPIMFQCYSSTSAFGKICDLPVQMRATPTASSSGTFTAGTAVGGAAGAFTSTLVDRPSANFLTTSGWTGSSGLAAGNATVVTVPDSAFIQASAEL
jgi:hypothetical protein